ncbi:DUF3263 domain-containing protein [Micromonospora okii]|uniref:DUF3263 domain-containing protein n=1 Tax=Micromonospora okii TaxID=1182970 RepID=UPI0035713D13
MGAPERAGGRERVVPPPRSAPESTAPPPAPPAPATAPPPGEPVTVPAPATTPAPAESAESAAPRQPVVPGQPAPPPAPGQPAASVVPGQPAAPAESAGPGVGAGGLTEREGRILAFEQQWWRHAGAKEQAIRDTFGLSATRYYRLLNALLDNPAALAAEPVLIGRLRRLRSSRARNRRR